LDPKRSDIGRTDSEDQRRVLATTARRLHKPDDVGSREQCDRERFGAAGITPDKISFERDTYSFNYPRSPADLLAAFRKFYGPTMNAFEAAEKKGRSDELQKELEDLFNSQNKSPSKDATSIPATFLRVSVVR
jgi:hypothetical protein